MKRATLPDIAAQASQQAQPLDWVGMCGIALPALIDGQVTVHALMEGLAAAGLRMQHDSTTGQFVIVAA